MNCNRDNAVDDEVISKSIRCGCQSSKDVRERERERAGVLAATMRRVRSHADEQSHLSPS